MEETGCTESLEELLAILKGTGNEKPLDQNNEEVSSDLIGECYVAPKAEAVLKKEAACELGEDTSTAEKFSNHEDDNGDGFYSKFSSKQWKERQGAYVEAMTLLNDESKRGDIVNELALHLADIVDDNNVSAMDSGLELVDTWVSLADVSQVKRVAGGISKSVISRGFACRNSSQSKCHEVLLKLMEVDSALSVVIEALYQGTNNKKPKVPPECVKCIKFAYKRYGALAMPNKDILSYLNIFFEAKSKDVRAAALELAEEMSRWMSRTPIESATMNLKDSVKKELGTLLDSAAGGRPIPTHGTRATREAALKASGMDKVGVTLQAIGGDGEEVKGLVLGPQEVDMFDLVEATDLPAKLLNTDYEILVSKNSKWNEKKKGIEMAISLLGPTPKIDHHCPGIVEFVRSLAPLINHSHFQVSSSAIKLFALIGRALREHFHSTCQAPEQFALLTGRFKDKKLAPLIGEALDQLVQSGALRLDRLDRVHEFDFDALVCPKKQPVCHARVAALEWLTRTVITMTMKENKLADAAGVSHDIASAHVHHLRSLLMKLAISGLTAAETEHRDASEKLLLAVCTTADKNPTAKEHTSMIKLISKELSGTKPKLAQQAEEALKNDPENSMLSEVQHSKAVPQSFNQIEVPDLVAGKDTASKKRSTDKNASAESDSVPPITLSGGDSIDHLGAILYSKDTELWNEVVKPGLLSSKWNEKTGAYNHIASRFGDETFTDLVGEASEAIVVVADHTTKGFSENNTVIITNAFDMISACAEHSSPASFHKGAAVLMTSIAVQKVSDRNQKLKQASVNLLTALSKAVGPSVVTIKICSSAVGLKSAPAALAILSWLLESVEALGARKFPLAPLCTLTLAYVAHRDAKVRSAALDILSSLYKEIGPKMKPLALPSTLSKSVTKSVEEVLDKAGFDPKAHTTKTSKDDSSQVSGVERLDIGSLLNMDEVLQKMNDVGDKDSWKQRKAALEEVAAAVGKSGAFLSYNNNMSEILRAVKKRVADNHNILKPMAISLLGELLHSIDATSVPKALRGVALELLAAVQDTKQQLREQVVKTLDYVVFADGEGSPPIPGALDSLFNHVCTSLKQPKIELLVWFKHHCHGMKVSDASVRLLPPLFSALQDKNKDIREASAECLYAASISGLLSKSAIEYSLKDQAPTVKRNLKPFTDLAIEKCEESAKDNAKDKSEIITTEVGTSACENQKNGSAVKEVPSIHVARADAETATSSENKIGLKRHNKKAKRNSEFKGLGKGWPTPPEDPKISMLQKTWHDYLSAEAEEALFPSKTRAGFMESAASGLDLLEMLMAEAEDGDNGWDLLLEHLDFIFKWITVRLCERESVPVFTRMLDFMVKLLENLHANQYTLSESEAQILLPYLCEKSGHNKTRFREQLQKCMMLCSRCHSTSKYASQLLSTCASTKQASTKVACLEELTRLITEAGKISSFEKHRKGFKYSMLIESAKYTEATDSLVRTAALQVVASAHAVMMYDANMLYNMLREGGVINAKGLTLINERLKTNKKEAMKRESPRLTKYVSHTASAPNQHIKEAKASASYEESRSSHNTMVNEDFGHLCLATPHHEDRQISRTAQKDIVKPHKLDLEDEDVFTFHAPDTPGAKTSKTDTPTLDSLAVSSGDCFDGFDLCGTPSPRDQSTPVSSRFDNAFAHMATFIASSDLDEQFDLVFKNANKSLMEIHDATLPNNYTACAEELVQNSNDLISSMLKCLVRSFPLAEDAELHLNFFRMTLASINALINLQACGKKLNMTVLQELLRVCVSRLLATSTLSPEQKEKSVNPLNTVISGAIRGCQAAHVVHALVKLVSFNGNYQETEDSYKLNVYLKLFTLLISKQPEAYTSIDMVKIAPDLAKLCESATYEVSSVNNCVGNMLQSVARTGHGNGMFTLTLCLYRAGVPYDHKIFSCIETARQSCTSVPYSTSDGNIEKLLLKFFQVSDPVAKQETANQLKEINEGMNNLASWLKYREVPPVFMEEINQNLLAMPLTEEIEQEAKVLIEQVKKPVDAVNRLQMIKDQMASLKASSQKTSSVASTSNPTSALGDATNRLSQVSLQDRLKALRDKKNQAPEVETTKPVAEEDSIKHKQLSLAERIARLKDRQ